MYNGVKASLSILALVIAAVAVLPVPVSATDDPLTIMTDTTLTADHDGSIIIGADSITLDCAGKSVIGSGSGIGIDFSWRTGVTVKNCEVTGFFDGFQGFFSDGNTLTENTASDNVIGFRLIVSRGNILTKNAACRNSGVDFDLLSGSGNVFVGNRFCTTSGIP